MPGILKETEMKSVHQSPNGPSGFIVIGDHGDGLVIPFSDNRSWLNLFYALPEEILEKRKDYLQLPRCPYDVFRSEEYDDLISDERFLELIWDSYAWAIWQCFEVPKKDGTYRSIPGIDLFYSGEFPLWRLAYYCVGLMREVFQHNGLGFQELYDIPEGQQVSFLSYQEWSNLIRNAVDEIIREKDLQPVIDEIWNNRTPEDYSEYYSKVKASFEAQWSHSRTKAGRNMQSLEQLMEKAVEGDGIFSLPDGHDYTEEALSRLQYEHFLSSLSDKDREVLSLKAEGYTDQEISEKLGYKTHSPIVKRLRKIRTQADLFIDDEYRRYKESHES